jgi:signal transduction histidine kinase
MGSGLGLYGVKSYIEILDGKILCENNIGGGVKFAIAIPNKHIFFYGNTEDK